MRPIQIKTVTVKSKKDYEEGHDPGEWVVFKETAEETEEDMEETIQRDWAIMMGRFLRL